MGFTALPFLPWKYLPPPSGEEHGISPVEDSRIRFTEEHGRCQEWDRDRLSRLQALQPYLTGLRVKGPSKALLVLTFQLAYFSWRVTPNMQEPGLLALFLFSPLSPAEGCLWIPTFSQGSRKVLPSVLCVLSKRSPYLGLVVTEGH